MSATGQPDLDPAAVRLLQVLADATRRRIFVMLLRGETCNCELSAELELSHNLISHHIKQLRLAGLVQERRDRHADHWVHYVLDADAVGAAVQALVTGLTPQPSDARRPCCERTPDGEPCATCASTRVARASGGRSGRTRRAASPTVTMGPAG